MLEAFAEAPAVCVAVAVEYQRPRSRPCNETNTVCKDSPDPMPGIVNEPSPETPAAQDEPPETATHSLPRGQHTPSPQSTVSIEQS